MSFPDELTRERRWLVARLEERDGRMTKVPYCAMDLNRRASSTDPETWTTFEVADDVAHGAGLLRGFVLGDGFAGVDLDHVVALDEAGTIESWAMDIVNRLDSYTEQSQSGAGLHIICKGTLPPGRRRMGQIELYDTARFFVMTGLGSGPVNERTSQLSALHASLFGPAEPAPEQLWDGRLTGRAALEAAGIDLNDQTGKENLTLLTDTEVYDRARSARNADKFCALFIDGSAADYGNDISSADLALASILMYHANGNVAQVERMFGFSALGQRAKWKHRADYRRMTLAKAQEEPRE